MPDDPLTAADSPAQLAIRLAGRAADEVRSNLSASAKRTALGRRKASPPRELYEIVLSPEQRRAMAEGTQRFATPGKGTATVRLRDVATGKNVSEARLEKVTGPVEARPSPAKVLGPVLWEAMAIATQQHFLVAIDKKLRGLDTAIGEILARDDDRTSAVLREVHDVAHDTLARLEAGDHPSSARLQEVQRLAGDARREWGVLYQRTRRLLDEYREGDTERETVEEVWSLLNAATEVLVEISGVLIAVPHASLEDLQATRSEEHARIAAALADYRTLADDLHAAHVQWRSDRLRWEVHGQRNPIANRIRSLRKQPSLAKPLQQELSSPVVRQLRDLLTPVPAPETMLVAIAPNGTVEVTTVPDGARKPAA